MNKLVILGKKELSRFYSLEIAIHRKNSDIPRIVADFRYLKTRLPQLNMTITLSDTILRNYLMHLRIILFQNWIYVV